MRFPALLCASFVIASPVAGQESTYPVEDVFEAFRDGCGPIENQEATSARLSLMGWRKVDSMEQKGALAEFMAFSAEAGEAAAEAEGATISELEAFEKTVSGEKVFIILDEVSADGIRVSGCQLYDFGETRAITSTMGEELLGRAPDDRMSHPELQKSEWNPGILPDHDSFKIFFVPPDSPVAGAVRFSGIALMSDTVGAE